MTTAHRHLLSCGRCHLGPLQWCRGLTKAPIQKSPQQHAVVSLYGEAQFLLPRLTLVETALLGSGSDKSPFIDSRMVGDVSLFLEYIT